MSGHGGRRNGSGRPVTYSSAELSKIGAACEALQHKYALESGIAALPHSEAIRERQESAKARIAKKENALTEFFKKQCENDIERLDRAPNPKTDADAKARANLQAWVDRLSIGPVHMVVRTAVRRKWLETPDSKQHTAIIEALLHKRAGTPIDEKSQKRSAPRLATVSTTPPYGTETQVIRDVAKAHGLSETTVRYLWQKYRRFEGKLAQHSALT